jgi:XTP/dITP diphosphohydrolase
MAYENLVRLAEVMDQLRSPGGCPWDAEQTHESLLKYLLEESYEFIESVESGNRQDMLEELGDVLLQVYFHARIAQENELAPFNIDDVAGTVADKLISRHPHVFSDVKVESTGDVLENWERIKNAEKGRTSAHDGVPTGQPALPLAAKLVYRAKKNHLPTPERPNIEMRNIAQINEEDIGAELLSLISLAVEHDIDPEVALRKAALKFRAQMSHEEGKSI